MTYGNQHVDTLSAAVGLRLEYTIAMDWGLLKPRGRLEYTHHFEGSSRASLGYADIGAFPYALDFNSFARDQVAIGLGVDAQIGEWWKLGLDYRTAFDGVGNSRDHTFGVRIGASF